MDSELHENPSFDFKVQIETPKTREYKNHIKEKIFVVFTLNEDIEERFLTLTTIKNILKNILNNPKEEKFRKLPKSNKKLESRVIKPAGSLDILKLVGFIEKTDVYQLPFDVSEEKIKKTIQIIENEIIKEYGDQLKENPSKDDLIKGKKKQDETKEKKKKEKELDQKAKDKVNQKIQQDKEKRHLKM